MSNVVNPGSAFKSGRKEEVADSDNISFVPDNHAAKPQTRLTPLAQMAQDRSVSINQLVELPPSYAEFATRQEPLTEDPLITRSQAYFEKSFLFGIGIIAEYFKSTLDRSFLAPNIPELKSRGDLLEKGVYEPYHFLYEAQRDSYDPDVQERTYKRAIGRMGPAWQDIDAELVRRRNTSPAFIDPKTGERREKDPYETLNLLNYRIRNSKTSEEMKKYVKEFEEAADLVPDGATLVAKMKNWIEQWNPYENFSDAQSRIPQMIENMRGGLFVDMTERVGASETNHPGTDFQPHYQALRQLTLKMRNAKPEEFEKLLKDFQKETAQVPDGEKLMRIMKMRVLGDRDLRVPGLRDIINSEPNAKQRLDEINNGRRHGGAGRSMPAPTIDGGDEPRRRHGGAGRPMPAPTIDGGDELKGMQTDEIKPFETLKPAPANTIKISYAAKSSAFTKGKNPLIRSSLVNASQIGADVSPLSNLKKRKGILGEPLKNHNYTEEASNDFLYHNPEFLFENSVERNIMGKGKKGVYEGSDFGQPKFHSSVEFVPTQQADQNQSINIRRAAVLADYKYKTNPKIYVPDTKETGFSADMSGRLNSSSQEGGANTGPSPVINMPITIHAPGVGTNELTQQIMNEVGTALSHLIERIKAESRTSLYDANRSEAVFM